jgi:hypothetical protein
MATIPLRILHPTDSAKVADGDADVELTLRDVCVDLQRGNFLPVEQPLNQLGAVLERTQATLPMTVAIRQLGLEPHDAVMLQKQTQGA